MRINKFGTPAFTLRVDGKSFSFEAPILLKDALRECGVSFQMPCGGHGICGKCVVFVKGCCDEKSEAEEAFLKRIKGMPEWEITEKKNFAPRLACFCHLLGDGEVILPESQMRIVSDTVGPLPAYDGGLMDSYGLAVDIGTTTIALRLYSLREGVLLSSAAEINDQSRFGADVLSRIEYSNLHGVKEVQRVLLSQLERMFHAVFQEAGCENQKLERVVFVGNTTMLHFLKGLDPKEIGVSPFHPQSLFGDTFRANALFAMFSGDVEAYIPRCVGAYIGADISAGMLATAFDQPGRKLLVDVGTNGEITLQNGDRIVCCATAAGPAFEGARISMGMPAMDGAIFKVLGLDRIGCQAVENAAVNRVGYQTIGNAPPRGICGTGMICLLALLRKEGVLDETGLLLTTDGPYDQYIRETNGRKAFMIGDSRVSLFVEDIRQIQLAKAAIAAGIDVLLHEEKLSAADIDPFLLAGGFGSQIQAEDAAGIGLIPRECVGQTVAVGNAALQGASMMLFSKKHREFADRIVQRAVEKPLSSHPFFMERYIENMMFLEVANDV